MKLIECFNCSQTVPESEIMRVMADFQTVFPHSVTKQPVIVSKQVPICTTCAEQIGIKPESKTK